jgi:hypothetical protein
MTTNELSLTWSEFVDQFKPETNKFSKDPDQMMYETYGEEVEWVSRMDPHYVWTYVDVDFGSVVVEGYHYVNRIGYFITEVPWIDSTSYEVDLQMSTCDNCSVALEESGYDCDGLCVNCCDHKDEREH